jgi:hypothetical protein
MRKIYLIAAFLLLLMQANLFSQDMKSYEEQKPSIENTLKSKGEIYFMFHVFDRYSLNQLSNVISIDKAVNNGIGFDVYAYANSKELNGFLNYNYKFALLTSPGDLTEGVKTSNDLKEITGQWDVYPTYDAYVALMNQFAATYPDICRIVDAGTTVQGRHILFAVISDSVNHKKARPQFMYTSSIHGDETAGYMFMLRLIDTLCESYNTVPAFNYLLKNVEIWINPLANPDGTYHGGNNTVNGAVRYNYNGYDLNRNFPDFSYNVTNRQQETIVMMNLAKANRFVMSVNFHGGAQVYNYPWDCVYPYHPDDDWYIHEGKRYVDTVHSVNSSYMTDLYGYPNYPGVTNGAAWYTITGGRQDYHTFFLGDREVTIELSNIKLLPQASLTTYFYYNYKSLVNYVKECTYGIRGIITDSVTGNPVKAKIKVVGKEYMNDSTGVFSDSTTGLYVRLIATGNYTLNIKADGYYPKTISNVRAAYDSTTILNIKMNPIATSITPIENAPSTYRLNQNYPNPFNPETMISFSIPANEKVNITLFDITGRAIATLIDKSMTAGTHELRLNANALNLNSGIYFYRLKAGNFTDSKSLVYIK